LLFQLPVDRCQKLFVQAVFAQPLAETHQRCFIRQGVTYVFNSWDTMPPVREQIAQPQPHESNLIAARFLLKPGRKYEGAVKTFQSV
jgi:hypothetical protein